MVVVPAAVSWQVGSVELMSIVMAVGVPTVGLMVKNRVSDVVEPPQPCACAEMVTVPENPTVHVTTPLDEILPAVDGLIDHIKPVLFVAFAL